MPDKMADKSENLWSKSVTEHDRADAIPPGVFKSGNPDEIAAALQKAAEDPQPRERRPLPLGHVDAEFLHQPRGPQPLGQRARRAREGQDGAAPAFRQDGKLRRLSV